MEEHSFEKLLEGFRYYMRLERSFSKNTSESYIRDCSRFAEWMQEFYPNTVIQDITVKMLDEFVSNMVKTKTHNEEDILLKSTSQIRIIQGIRAFFKYLLLQDIIEKNPAELITTPKQEHKLPEVLEREEIQAMINSIDASTLAGFRNKLTINFLYATGLRVSEFVNLKLSEVNFKEEILDIIGKGNKERYIPVAKSVLDDLEFYIKHYRTEQKISKESENFIFLSERQGKPLTRQFIFKMLRETAQKAGIKKNVHPHILRHSFATELIRGGANLIAVKEMMGHSSVVSTEIYINLSTKDLKNTLENYHPFYRK
ncbi:MAG: tyrosine-type recombinase/integrase [Bacteroidales bacterium]|nr:tyrosine-type recombinase/integrase [Bacteroidales bacterium]